MSKSSFSFIGLGVVSEVPSFIMVGMFCICAIQFLCVNILFQASVRRIPGLIPNLNFKRGADISDERIDWSEVSPTEIFDAPLTIVRTIGASNCAVSAMDLQGDLLFVGLLHPEVHVYHLPSLQLRCIFACHSASITSLTALDPRGGLAANEYIFVTSSSVDGAIILWSIPSSQSKPTTIAPVILEHLAPLGSQDAAAESLHSYAADAADGICGVWAGGHDGRIRVWTWAGASGAKQAAGFAAHRGAVTAICATAAVQASLPRRPDWRSAGPPA